MLTKGVKKCGLLLAFFIIFGLSLNVSLNSSALQHNVVSMPFASINLPYSTQCFILNSSTGKYEYNPDHVSGDCSYAIQSYFFQLKFEGDSFDSSLWDNIGPVSSLSYLSLGQNDDNSCYFTSPFGNLDYLRPIQYYSSGNDHYISSGSLAPANGNKFNFIYPLYTKPTCISRNKFNENNQGSAPSLSNVTGFLTCSRDNGAVCGGLWDKRNYINNQIYPYWYGQDALYLQSSYKADDGLRYSNNFSFNDLFTVPIHKFSHLTIPINDFDEWYFYNPDNLTAGRSFNVNGSFDFKGSFNWHSNISSNGSYFRLYYKGWSANTNANSSFVSDYVDCDTNLITLGENSTTQLQYSCPLILPDDMIYLDLSIQIDGNGNYVWSTDNDWFFYTTYVTTDNDTTKGRSFGTSVTGGASKKIGSAVNNSSSTNNDIVVDGANFSQSLIQLFGFSFLNPFAPLLQMFSDNNQCVQIPTLAGMIHSESTEVCPWFDSSVRNIATPVLSISSMMLIFGFSVRWLGSRSGNFIEDSDSHESGGISVGKRGRK